MSHAICSGVLFGLLSLLIPSPLSGQDVIISEFVASNSGSATDEDGETSDWIELYNTSAAAVNLQGWRLTDNASESEKWLVPDVTLDPGGFLVIFASGKDRRVLGNTWDTVVRTNDAWRYRVGNTAPASWNTADYNDLAWVTGSGPLGYGEPGLATTVPNGTQGLFIRRKFDVDDPQQVLRGLLHVSYDDGFVAYVNGTEVARANCCTAPAAGEPGPLEAFSLSNIGPLLRQGENVLAIEVRNSGTNSSDLLISAFLTLEFSAPPSVLRGVADAVRPIPESRLHTNFSLAIEGEFLGLYAPDGTPSTVFNPYPPQFAGGSYGFVDGIEGYFNTPTPGAPNAENVRDLLDPPTFSMNHGFFDSPFKLLIIPDTPGSTIRYTLDGSLPTASNGQTYTEPLLIDRTTVVRAVAIAPGAINSPSVTQTYLFPDDVIRQSANGAPPPGWPSRWNTNAVDYGMDPDIVNGNETAVIQSLLSLPSFSIVTDLDHLFDPQTGIYSNALGYGREWERPTSAELIYPDGTTGFQVNAGLRIRGGYSRNDPNPKHAFRLYFRNDYGPGKLRYPLFGDEGVDEFDTIDLRTSQNYSWAYNGDGRNTMAREVWARDTQREMQAPYTRSRYYHLYINGQYWGVFQTQERAEASYGESYLGGSKDDYDVIKSAGLADGYQIEATDGNFDAWRVLWEGVNELPLMTNEADRTAAFYRLQGLNPDGTRNPSYEVLLDADNLIDYMLVIFFTGNFDAPISGFLGNDRTNNFFSVRRRGGDRGFVHFAHDNEHTFLPEDDRYTNRTGPYPAGLQFPYSNPQWLHQQLMASAEYRLRFADRAHRHLFNDGALTTPAVLGRFERRVQQVGPAMLAESARWGDSKRSSPLRVSDWQNEINRLRNNILPPRTVQIISQLRSTTRYVEGHPARGTTSAPLYPAITAPTFSQHGGEVASAFALEITAPSGEIFYTLDGTDPRRPGGDVAPAASAYGGAIILSEPTTVRARVRTGTGWSAVTDAHFRPGSIAPSAARFVISEINYNPAPPTSEELANGYSDAQDFEFLELLNLTSETLDLSGIRFVDGIEYQFASQQVPANGRILLVSNAAAVAFRYGAGLPVVGTYQGRLNNAGERLALASSSGEVLFSVNYDDDRPWPSRPDGRGSSLELVDVSRPDRAASWRASFDYLGSPGRVGTDQVPGVVINEILTNTVDPQLDAIELYNSSNSEVDVSGWFLSDGAQLAKFQIPAGTTIPAGGYLAFDENDFNAPDDSLGFALSGDRGESLWLTMGDQQGRITHFADELHFPALREGESLGRWPDGTGVHFPMQEPTLGSANSGPRVGPVVLREIMYEPPGNNPYLEYILIQNAGASNEDLSLWSVSDGVSYSFPHGATLGAGEALTLVAFDPVVETDKARAFRQAYWHLQGAKLYGPWSGRLDNAGEPVLLHRAGPRVDDPDPFYPQMLEDRVTYASTDPWPTDAAGGGAALRRVEPLAYSEDPTNWLAPMRPVTNEDPHGLPNEMVVGAPYPNPASGEAAITVRVPSAQHVRIWMYDVLGRQVARVFDGALDPAQTHRISIHTGNLASGLYLVRVIGERAQETTSITVIR